MVEPNSDPLEFDKLNQEIGDAMAAAIAKGEHHHPGDQPDSEVIQAADGGTQTVRIVNNTPIEMEDSSVDPRIARAMQRRLAQAEQAQRKASGIPTRPAYSTQEEKPEAMPWLRLPKMPKMPEVSGVFGNKKILIGGIIAASVVILIVIGVVVWMLWGTFFPDTTTVVVTQTPFSFATQVPQIQVTEVPPVVVHPEAPPLPTYDGWNLFFSVPINRLGWNLGWWIVIACLILINLFFRSETVHRGEVWDYINVTFMLVLAALAMIFAKGVVVVALDQCQYWFVDECKIGPLTIELIETGALWVAVIAGIGVFIGSAVAAFTGRRDFTSWAVGTFCVGILAKLLLPLGPAQMTANAIIVLGLLIYILEIGGLANGKLALGGLLALGVGLVVMSVGAIVLSLAFGYLSGAASSWPFVADWLYHGRFLWGLLTGWLMATAITYALTPAMVPQVQRLATGSVVVGDSEKIDTIIFLMMVICSIFVFNWASVIAALT